MIEKYYEILGISPNATFQEIKKAYRNRARELHPDVNKSPNAHNEFILLTEGYEYLMNLKTGKVFNKANTNTRPYQTYKRWQDDEAARARHRAEYYANMKYKKFTDSEYYERITSIDVILDHIGFFLSVGIVFILPVVMTLLYDFYGTIASLIVILITSPVTINAIKYSSKISYKEFVSALKSTNQATNILIIVISIINIFLFLNIGLQTMIPFFTLLFIFVTLIIISKLIIRFGLKNENHLSNLISYCLLPLTINLFLAINFIFSKNKTYETYHFTTKLEPRRGGGWQASTYIILDDQKYQEFYGIRVFEDYTEMAGSSRIQYTFKDGLFGVRVMSDYEFQ